MFKHKTVMSVHCVKHADKNAYKHIIKSFWSRHLLFLHSVTWDGRRWNLLLSSTHLSSLYNRHSITKCLSSSIVYSQGIICYLVEFWALCVCRVQFRGDENSIEFGKCISLTKSEYGSKFKSLFSSLYNSNMGCLFELRSLECQPSRNVSFIVILISLVCKSGWSMYCWAISPTLLTHVRKPWLCRLRNAVKPIW